ncbi:hypothetical protein OESDEN_22416 [Oesophagostomum dentatum]|uniref:Lipid-binding serum glycoprotein N-terminal domain-containing protein n=1 Tax=Oesophagostomum dentatum TaxID=61180 RepID=A0A0B1RZ48_OESDE|nr:hypothetical protein OESDEN_22416 [Oesophagostomum dentatum]
MTNGIRINIKEVRIQASARGEADIGKEILRKWLHIAYVSGGIKYNSNLNSMYTLKATFEWSNLDVQLQWSDFKFIPVVNMNSKIRIGFTYNLKLLYLVKGKIEKFVNSKVNSEVPKKIAEAIDTYINPHLQQLKHQMESKDYKDYDIEWTVQNNSVRATVKPKSGNNTPSKITPINDMACVNANIIKVLAWLPLGSKGAAVSCV